MPACRARPRLNFHSAAPQYLFLVQLIEPEDIRAENAIFFAHFVPRLLHARLDVFKVLVLVVLVVHPFCSSDASAGIPRPPIMLLSLVWLLADSHPWSSSGGHRNRRRNWPTAVRKHSRKFSPSSPLANIWDESPG